MDKKLFSIEFFFSQVRKSLSRIALLFHYFRLLKNIFRQEEVYKDFTSKVSCVTVSENFVGEPVCTVLHKVSGSEKVYG